MKMDLQSFRDGLGGCRMALFDLDDTVIDGNASAGIGYGYLKREYKDKHWLNAGVGFAGGLTTELFRRVGQEGLGLTTFVGSLNLAGCADMQSAYQFAEHYVRKHGMPGVKEFVTYLKRLGLRTAVYTGGVDVSAAAAQREFGFDDHFAVYTFNGSSIVKSSGLPNIEKSVKGSRKEIKAMSYVHGSGCAFDYCFVVGDSETDEPIMRRAHLSLASPRAKERVKRTADFWTPDYRELVPNYGSCFC